MSEKQYPVKRGLDGILYRVQRNGKYENVCFSDLNEAETDEMLRYRSVVGLRELCRELQRTIRHIGDHFDIVAGVPKE